MVTWANCPVGDSGGTCTASLTNCKETLTSHLSREEIRWFMGNQAKPNWIRKESFYFGHGREFQLRFDFELA